MKYNRDTDMFQLITDSTTSMWSGSQIPLLREKIEWYKKLLTITNGIDFIEHKHILECKIENTEKYIVEVEIQELVDK